MSRTMFFLFFLALTTIAGNRIFAQTDQVAGISKQENADSELVQLRDRMEKAFQAHDVEALTRELGPDVVITWQNGSRNLGADEFQAFYQEMLVGDTSTITNIKTTRELDGVPLFYGDTTAIAYGTVNEDITFRDGDAFTLQSKWTATLVQTGGQWQVVSYHISADAFNNPVLAAAKRYLITFATVGAFFGFLLGALIMWFVVHSTRRLADVL